MSTRIPADQSAPACRLPVPRSARQTDGTRPLLHQRGGGQVGRDCRSVSAAVCVAIRGRLRLSGKALKGVRVFPRAFTLIEIMVVMAIFIAILSVLAISFLMSRVSYATMDTTLYVQQEGRRALDTMAAELRLAGNVNNNVSIAAPGGQQLDFQLDQGYDPTVCGGVCWGSGNPLLPWVHYVLDTVTTAPNGRLRRCLTANRLDPMPANFAGCGVIANNVSPNTVMTAFTYDHPTRAVIATLQIVVTSRQVAGGRLDTGALPLRVQIRLRNP